ncbi:hypothetical protein EBZ38_05230 [bacterium]|nr:hypothetical protein [bacterium]
MLFWSNNSEQHLINKIDAIQNKLDIVTKHLEIKNWVKSEVINYVNFRGLLNQSIRFLQADIHETLLDQSISNEDKMESVNETISDFSNSIFYFFDCTFSTYHGNANVEVHNKLEMILEKLSNVNSL